MVGVVEGERGTPDASGGVLRVALLLALPLALPSPSLPGLGLVRSVSLLGLRAKERSREHRAGLGGGGLGPGLLATPHGLVISNTTGLGTATSTGTGTGLGTATSTVTTGRRSLGAQCAQDCGTSGGA